ncbi:hypothetical protein CPC197_1603, partial [Chlamydia psittaci C1/97]
MVLAAVPLGVPKGL